MTDMISKQTAIDGILGQPPEPHYPSWYADIIRKLPPEEPERKRGKWISNSPVTMRCNHCTYVASDWIVHEFHYCPNCGFDMRGGEDE